MMIKTLDNVYINMEDFSGFTIGYPNDSDFTVMAMKELVDNQTATIELGRYPSEKEAKDALKKMIEHQDDIKKAEFFGREEGFYYISNVFTMPKPSKNGKARVKINTDSYKCKRCSKKNWEPGTMNDYMLAINGITRTIYTKRELIWQLELFRGQSFLLSEYDSNNPEENFGLSNRYVKFLKKNTIKYYDRLCGFERQQYLSGYGFMQGYFDIDKVLDLLKKEGYVKVPFSWLYDIRQYDKCMDGCYMEITKVA